MPRRSTELGRTSCKINLYDYECRITCSQPSAAVYRRNEWNPRWVRRASLHWNLCRSNERDYVQSRRTVLSLSRWPFLRAPPQPPALPESPLTDVSSINTSVRFTDSGYIYPQWHVAWAPNGFACVRRRAIGNRMTIAKLKMKKRKYRESWNVQLKLGEKGVIPVT